MPASDDMVARLQEQADYKRELIEQTQANARDADRDMTESEHEMTRGWVQDLSKINDRLADARETQRIVRESQANKSAIANEQTRGGRGGDGKIEYRSAGVYVADRYLAMIGDDQAQARQEMFHRAAAHQTTADNPGLLPERIVGPIVNFVNETRPIVSVLNPTDLGTGTWAYARVTQHTQVAVQSAEKAELASRKMTITKTPITAPTYGGYVNVSRQDISRTTPQILDMVINDLAGQYAIQTEAATATAMTTAAQTGPVIPATPTALNIATAIFTAAGTVYANVQGQGRIVVAMSPDQFGIIGPVFPGINPQNAFSPGFQASDLNFGAVGTLSGLTVVMSAGLATDTILVFSTAAVRAFENRYGALQVVEPSVWGVQVGYAGDFQCLVVEPLGIVRPTTA